MSTVALLLVAIVMLILFTIIYLSIRSDFDELVFENKLSVLTEWVKRNNAEMPTPDTIGYVSHVNGNLFTVTWFNSETLVTVQSTIHNDTIEVFDFVNQRLIELDHLEHEPRIKPDPDDPYAFWARVDDGWMRVECPNRELFDQDQLKCVPLPPCYKRPPGLYPMDENLIDTLVLNHRVYRNPSDTDHLRQYHPTLYLRCVLGGSHVIEECPDNHTFNVESKQCELRNDCEIRPDGYVLSAFPESLNIDEYLTCQNQMPTVTNCPSGMVFDRRLMSCVTAHPCMFQGVGYTYITNDILDNQFYRCLSNTDAELVTCINRVFANGSYECGGSFQCQLFDNGTGTEVRSSGNTVLDYDEGMYICDNYNLVTDINCDTTNMIENRSFNEDKFTVDVGLPVETYNIDTQTCQPFDLKSMRVLNPVYPIGTVETNDYAISFETAFVGDTNRIDELLQTDRLDGLVRYARDRNAIGIDPTTDEPIECDVEPTMYDIFAGDRVNFCSEQGEKTESVALVDGMYYRPLTNAIGADDDYDQECAKQMSKTSNFVELDRFLTRILANIQQSDVCDQLLHLIHEKYTTVLSKYTTTRTKPSTKVKTGPENIVVSGVNTRKRGSTILEKSLQTSIENDSADDTLLLPYFDPFQRQEDDEPMNVGRDLADNHQTPPRSPARPDPVEPDESESESEPPLEVTLTDKTVEFGCFYSLPVFKMTACHVVDEHIEEAVASLRANVTADEGCESAIGLGNIINAYAYMGNGTGCLSHLSADRGIVVEKITLDPYEFLNLDTQSNDNIKYNDYVHRTADDKFFACPPELVNGNDCDVEPNRLYYLQDMHRT
ncbi:vp91 capsid protein [Leucania separata nucleopolyhedrovirus]|uniref:Vp91 capsid protein n=1 Tax=Leucania separata nucleopolyhedrovirus TaxID=1307956 RepID=Q0IL25_NPVLS|nr:vp91 capsid protein [Leucania separata nucleopolyhedrovirus]AAR28858.1 vp91 capsid protein [Leucania separata nucleopolyhedrovirus]